MSDPIRSRAESIAASHLDIDPNDDTDRWAVDVLLAHPELERALAASPPLERRPPASDIEWEQLEVGPLCVQETWRDADGTSHTAEWAALGPGVLAEVKEGGRAR